VDYSSGVGIGGLRCQTDAAVTLTKKSKSTDDSSFIYVSILHQFTNHGIRLEIRLIEVAGRFLAAKIIHKSFSKNGLAAFGLTV
jgi:hypothetical protein